MSELKLRPPVPSGEGAEEKPKSPGTTPVPGAPGEEEGRADPPFAKGAKGRPPEEKRDSSLRSE